MDLTLRHVDYLRALGEHGSFTKAAAALHVAQPAVSQTIKMLESGLGIEVYDRAARRLTEAGEILTARGARASSELAAALDEVRSLGGLTEGRLRIGAIHWVEPFDLASALAEFHKRHPRIDLSLHEDDAVVMLERLQAGDLDLVIHNAGPATVRAGTGRRVLARERVVVAVGEQDPWSARKRVRMEDLTERHTITFRKGAAFRTLVDESFAEQGLRLQVALESSDLLGVRALAAAGLGAAIVPRSVAEAPGPPVIVLELLPAIDREVVLVWRTDHTPPPTVLALLEILRR